MVRKVHNTHSELLRRWRHLDENAKCLPLKKSRFPNECARFGHNDAKLRRHARVWIQPHLSWCRPGGLRVRPWARPTSDPRIKIEHGTTIPANTRSVKVCPFQRCLFF